MADDMSDISELKTAIGVLTERVANGQSESNRRFGELRENLGAIKKTIDDQSNVPLAVFREFEDDVKRTYVTRGEIRDLRLLFWGIISALVVGLIGLGFAWLQGQIT